MKIYEHKHMKLDVKKIDMEQGIVEGYASTFGGEPDWYNEIVNKGAFTKTINERFKAGKVKILEGHDSSKPIGKPIELYEDAYGLYIKFQLSKTRDYEDRLKVLLADGVYDSMSIGFNTILDEYDRETGIRYLKEVSLFEVSLVTFPANENATITSVKSEKDIEALMEGCKQYIENETKEGRTLSARTRAKIDEALKALQELIAEVSTDDPDSEDSTDSKKQPDLTELKSALAQLRETNNRILTKE